MPQQQQGQRAMPPGLVVLVLQVTLLSWPYCGSIKSTMQHGSSNRPDSWLLSRSAAGGTFAVCNGAVKDPEADEGIAVCEQRLLCHLEMASCTARRRAPPTNQPRGLGKPLLHKRAARRSTAVAESCSALTTRPCVAQIRFSPLGLASPLSIKLHRRC